MGVMDVAFDAVDGVEGIGREEALAAMGATDDRYIVDIDFAVLVWHDS